MRKPTWLQTYAEFSVSALQPSLSATLYNKTSRVIYIHYIKVLSSHFL